MRKLPSVSVDDRKHTRRRRTTAFAIATLLLICSPILYESALLIISNWRGLFGTVTYIETPVLDALSESYKSSSFDLRNWARGVFNSSPWKSSYVVPFAIFWTGVLAMLLRRC